MSRVHDRPPAFAVGQALSIIPDRILPLVGCEFIIGVDPNFAGIHEFETYHYDGEVMTYRDSAHCTYAHNQIHRPVSFRTTKVILPENPAYQWDTTAGVGTVVHELGHVLHEFVGFEWDADPVTEYAKTDRYEAFAEAFEFWVWSRPIDEKTQALFNRMAFG